MPEVLVGTWGGGSYGATADRNYTFQPSGDVLHRRGTDDVEGTVVVEGDTPTPYLEGSAPQRYRWSTDSSELDGHAFSNLYLDGCTFVRQDAP